MNLSISTRHTLTTLITFFLIFSFSHLYGETIFLKDGSIIKGKITADKKQGILVLPENGPKILVKRKNILRVIYTKTYMGKVAVKKNDGKKFEAFLVDEDQTHYTFRWKLNSPEEFKIHRTEIIHLSRMDPTALKATVLKDRVELTWQAPYSIVKRYNIYIRKAKQKGKYRLAGQSIKTAFTLFDMEGKTYYNIMVRAVDISGEESQPSNIITAMNSHVKLKPPDNVSCVSKDLKKSGIFAAELTWDMPGNIEQGKHLFRIYRREGHRNILTGETAAARYSVFGLAPERVHNFIVRTVDPTGNESDDSITVSSRSRRQFSLAAEALFCLPLGYFSDMHNPGGGVMLSGAFSNILMNYLTLGLETGTWYFTGKTEMVDYSMVIPAVFFAGYRLALPKNIFIEPRLGMGLSLDMISYDPGYKSTGNDTPEYSMETSVNVILRTGLTASWSPAAFYTLNAGIGYSVILEEESVHFLTFSISCARRL